MPASGPDHALTARDARNEPIAHGFSTADIDDIAALASSTVRWPGRLDWRTRAEVAWSAIAEYLVRLADDTDPAGGPPTRRDLTIVGWSAIGEYARKDDSFRGFNWGYESTSTPKFERYWALAANPSPCPANGIVERRALAQIWAALPEKHRRILLALAELGHYAEAAEALGLTRGSFYALVSRARRAFLALWHEGETPSRPWGHDVRGRKGNTKAVTVIAVRQRVRHRAARPDRSANSHAKRDIGVPDAELALRYKAGESYEAIAATLDLSASAIRSRVLPLL
ncbi:RNA polymerase sigma factor [Nocardiopsis sediminis]|uniref:RNA polymerase sigma factor n=1 Tax=Nocardiopsis sediminis TaxID=1778267 RepID=A0ABV8FJW5_9ACTN